MEKPNEKPAEKPKCPHTRTFVSIRHVSGLHLVKCHDCGQVVYNGF